MIRSLILAASLFVGFTATAKTATITDVMVGFSHQVIASEANTSALHFAKGDTANYSLTIGSMINGTMVMTVDDIVADGVWLSQNMDLGFAGKQQIRTLIDPNTGAIKKMIVNGKEQTPPSGDDITVIDSKADTITVPAGTFECLWIKAHSKSQNADVEQWANLKEVPVMGLVQLKSTSQIGPVVAQLTSSKRM